MIDAIFPGASRKTNKFEFTGRRTLSKTSKTPASTVNMDLPLCNLAAKNSMVATIEHDIHRKRRSTVASFFSSASVRKLEPIMKESIGKLLSRMEAAGRTGEIMPMNYVFKACTSDVITKYAFGKSTNFLDLEDYAMEFMLSVDVLFLLNHAFCHFPLLGSLTEATPPWAAKVINPGMYQMHLMKEVSKFALHVRMPSFLTLFRLGSNRSKISKIRQTQTPARIQFSTAF
jgi:hypothetical protein